MKEFYDNTEEFLKSLNIYLRIKDFINSDDRGTEKWTTDDEEVYQFYLKKGIVEHNGDIYFLLDD